MGDFPDGQPVQVLSPRFSNPENNSTINTVKSNSLSVPERSHAKRRLSDDLIHTESGRYHHHHHYRLPVPYFSQSASDVSLRSHSLSAPNQSFVSVIDVSRNNFKASLNSDASMYNDTAADSRANEQSNRRIKDNNIETSSSKNTIFKE